jgi:hypothetical protein
MIVIIARCLRLAQAWVLDWDILSHYANEEIITSLRNTPAFIVALSFHAQWWAACQVLRFNHRPVVPYSIIGDILGTSKGTLKYHCRIYEARASIAGTNVRRPLITETQLAQLVAKVEGGYENRRPWTIVEVVNFLQEKVQENLDRNTMHHILARDP